MDRIIIVKGKIREVAGKWRETLFGAKSPGIDGILVTVGLCIIALILCVVMKNSLTTFIQQLVNSMAEKAEGVLNNGVTF